MIEVTELLKAAFFGNFLDGRAGAFQHMRGIGYADALGEPAETYAHGFSENFAETAFAYSAFGGRVIQCYYLAGIAFYQLYRGKYLAYGG